MYKVVAVWQGWAGGPGFSNFYFGGSPDGVQASQAAARVRAFFLGIVSALPSVINITIQPTVQEITPGDGQIIDEKPITTVPAPVQGAGGPGFSAPSGACIIWRTGVNVGGRLLKGKTFIVPMAKDAYDIDGTIAANRLTELQTFSAALANPGTFAEEQQLHVWHRPTAGTGGSSAPTVSSSVSDRAAILRSRRA